MNLLGKMMYKAACRKVGELGITTHPMDYLTSVLTVGGRKTLERRLCDGQWQFNNLVEFQQHFDDDIVEDYIEATLKNARKSCHS